MDTIQSIVGTVLSDIQKKHGGAPQELERTWSKSVTKKIQQHTRPYKLKSGKLFVFVENSAWLFELNIQKKILIEKIQQQSKGKIKDIRFSIGEIHGRK